MNSHPAWKYYSPENYKNYQNEAKDLAIQLKNKSGEKSAIWVLYKDDSPINLFLLNSLNENFKLAGEQEIPSPNEPTWTDRIYSFTAK